MKILKAVGVFFARLFLRLFGLVFVLVMFFVTMAVLILLGEKKADDVGDWSMDVADWCFEED